MAWSSFRTLFLIAVCLIWGVSVVADSAQFSASVAELSDKSLVGTMANVDGNRLQFVWSGARTGISSDQGKQLFYEGSDLKLKFQVKLIKKGYFEIGAKVTEVQATEDDGIRVTVGYESISEGDQAALGQFAADMEFLKRQLPGS